MDFPIVRKCIVSHWLTKFRAMRNGGGSESVVLAHGWLLSNMQGAKREIYEEPNAYKTQKTG